MVGLEREDRGMLHIRLTPATRIGIPWDSQDLGVAYTTFRVLIKHTSVLYQRTENISKQDSQAESRVALEVYHLSNQPRSLPSGRALDYTA